MSQEPVLFTVEAAAVVQIQLPAQAVLAAAVLVAIALMEQRAKSIQAVAAAVQLIVVVFLAAQVAPVS
jgi:hypothetical protein